MRARLTVRFLVCLLALQLVSRAQAADLIFDNGPSNGDDGWEMTEYFEADDFVVANRTLLSGAKFWNYAKAGSFTGSVTWEIYSNSAAGPGQLVASGTSTPSSHTPTGYVLFGTLHEAVTTFDITPVLLEPGTYWLALHNGPRQNTTRGMFWAPTDNRPSSGSASYSRGALSSGAWFSNAFPGFPSDLAFQVFGTAVAAPTPTPTPLPTATPTPTATPVLTPTPTPTPTATPQPTPTPTATPTATPPPSPSPSATPPPPRPRQLLNIATRLRVQTGENVLIGGLIVTGNGKKKVIIRAIGPSLAGMFSGALADPIVELYQGETRLAGNDNWKDTQRDEIEASGIPPKHERESAIVYTLEPGFYTAVMTGSGGGTGIGVIEVYDLEQGANSSLANIATRGFVQSGENVMIGGLIVGGNGSAEARVLLRAIGPSLSEAGVAGALQDPVMDLRNEDGDRVLANDDWEDTQRAAIEATTLAPKHRAESAILVDLRAGNYTAIVEGFDGAVGVGVVEVYHLK
jgi:hypothetical protein